MIKAIFCDICGVCLTNAWETPSRRKAAEHFSIDYSQLESRHQSVFEQFERGEMSLHEYLTKVIFDQPRPFSEDAFIRFMYNESRPYENSLAVLRQLRQSGRYLICALNNESRELNEFRIKTFALQEYFSLFFTSCFLGVRKPDGRIYQIALDVTRKNPQETLFIDDRLENVKAAQAQSMKAIHLQEPPDLAEALRRLGIEM